MLPSLVGADVTKARKAQEWMSWALPVRCETVAASLTQKSKLMGATLRVNEDAPPPAPAETPAETTAAPAAEAPQDPPAN